MDKSTVVVDEGSAQIKLVWFDEGMKSHIIPSRAVMGSKPEPDGQYSPASYKINGIEYTCDAEMDGVMPTDHSDYQTSHHNRALMHEALRQAGFGGCEIDIITTLPVEQFFKVKPRNEALIDAKKKNARGDIINLRGEALASIKEVSVAPEAIPCWNDVRLDDEGKLKPEFANARRILLVDIGGTTTDLTLIFSNGRLEDYASHPSGVFNLRRNLAGLLYADDDIKTSHILDAQIDYAIQTGEFYGKDVKSHIDSACNALTVDIVNKMRSLARDSNTVDCVIYAGGGAKLIGKRLDAAFGGHSVFPDRPDLSIARGIYKTRLAKELAGAL